MNQDDSQEMRGCITPVRRKGNIRAITITDNVPEHFPLLIQITKDSYDFYAYIIHDSDDGVEPHIHILATCKGGTTLKAHCERYSSVIPSNFVCIVTSIPAMAKYLIHKNRPEKHQYDVSAVITNSKEHYMKLVSDGPSDSKVVWQALCDLKFGSITPDDFIDRFSADLASMPFYQKYMLLNKIHETYGGANHF